MKYVFLSLLVSLLLTLALELGFALALRKRDRALRLVAVGNCITNPVVVLAALLWRHSSLPAYSALVALLETGAVVAEGRIYQKNPEEFARPILFSLSANCFSFGFGLIISLIN